MVNPKAFEILSFLSTHGINLTFICDKGYEISKTGRCTCLCDNSKQVEARKEKFEKIKNFTNLRG